MRGQPTLALIEELVRWAGPAFAAAGYWIIAFGAISERSIFIGLIVPGDTLMAIGGIYAARGELDLAAVILVGAVAAGVGESAGYWLGRRYGVPLIRRLPLAHRLEKRLGAAREYFDRRGGLTVAVGRMATAAGTFVPFTAGLAHMSYPRFLAWDLPAIAAWAVGVALLGYFFGKNLELIDTILSRYGWVVAGLLVAFVLGRWLWKRRRRGRS